MELRKIVIGLALSTLLAVPATVLAGSGSQMGSGQMGSGQMGGAQMGDAHRDSSGMGMTSTDRASHRLQMRTVIGSVQEKLNAQGYNVGKADGIWGPRTTAALKKYQQENGLQATGRLNQETADALGLEQGEFARFEQTIHERAKSQMEKKQQQRIRQPGDESGGM